jgi:hypothetical protein
MNPSTSTGKQRPADPSQAAITYDRGHVGLVVELCCVPRELVAGEVEEVGRALGGAFADELVESVPGYLRLVRLRRLQL